MKLNASDAAEVLKTFIQEDRIESRIYRGRVQNVTYTLTVASFAISAFLIGNVPHMAASQLRYMTLLIDFGLAAVMLIFFRWIKADLILLRKGMKARQDLLYGVVEGQTTDIDVFPKVDRVDPDIRDDDLSRLVRLSVAVVLIKMAVLAVWAGFFVSPK